jgi:exonuclease III
MRIVSWNLGHQTQERRLKSVFLPTIAALDPDALVLNEYVDGSRRAEMKAALRRQGLVFFQCSDRVGKHNQVLIASRTALGPGTVTADGLDDTARSNFLSVGMQETGIEIVGFRAPAYEARSDKVAFWSVMDRIIRDSSARPVIFIGDMNADPNDSASPGGVALAALRSSGWQLPRATGEWSFARKNARTRIDHAVVAPSVPVLAAAYCATIGEIQCAGPDSALYDHAPLTIDIA